MSASDNHRIIDGERYLKVSKDEDLIRCKRGTINLVSDRNRIVELEGMGNAVRVETHPSVMFGSDNRYYLTFMPDGCTQVRIPLHREEARLWAFEVLRATDRQP